MGKNRLLFSVSVLVIFVVANVTPSIADTKPASNANGLSFYETNENGVKMQTIELIDLAEHSDATPRFLKFNCYPEKTADHIAGFIKVSGNLYLNDYHTSGISNFTAIVVQLGKNGFIGERGTYRIFFSNFENYSNFQLELKTTLLDMVSHDVIQVKAHHKVNVKRFNTFDLQNFRALYSKLDERCKE